MILSCFHYRCMHLCAVAIQRSSDCNDCHLMPRLLDRLNNFWRKTNTWICFIFSSCRNNLMGSLKHRYVHAYTETHSYAHACPSSLKGRKNVRSSAGLMVCYMSPVKRICVFEHSVMTNFNCACPAIQRGQGSGFLSESSSWFSACMSEQRRFWRDCADAQARLNLRCSHRR